MTLNDLRGQLERLDVVVLPSSDGELELDTPDGVVLTDEVIEALHEHKAALLAYAARRAKCEWPVERQMEWGRAAHRLETQQRVPFPDSEVEAYRMIAARMERSEVFA